MDGAAFSKCSRPTRVVRRSRSEAIIATGGRCSRAITAGRLESLELAQFTSYRRDLAYERHEQSTALTGNGPPQLTASGLYELFAAEFERTNVVYNFGAKLLIVRCGCHDHQPRRLLLGRHKRRA